MTIFVSGAAGFIGTNICESLLKLNHTVIGIDNFDKFYSDEIKRSNINDLIKYKRFNFYESDIRNETILNLIFSLRKIDVVIHLAAKPGVLSSINLIRDYFEVNVDGTISLLQSMRKFCIKNLIFGSSSSVYGGNYVPFYEYDTNQCPVSPYGITKRSGEQICELYCNLHSFNITCLRFFSVYGPRQRPDLVIHKFTKLISENKPIPFFGDGKTSRDYTYIIDIFDGINCAINNLGGYKVYNLASSCSIDLETVVKYIEDRLCKKAQKMYMLGPPGELYSTLGDISKAKSEIGYFPKYRFEEGMKEFMDWFLKIDSGKVTYNL